ncbi:MAG: hypothetical protein LUH05_01660 [Candidatus Gastranaerophilales bacterium]|nr:hypothetical protein [Candidatus Gastranaerophilales bacterium]
MITDPVKKLGGKAAPGIQFASQAFTGHTAGDFKNKDFFVSDYGNTQKTGWDRVGAIGKTAVKSFVPFSANDILNPDKEFSPVSLFAPVSKGMTKYKAINEFKKVYQNGGNNEDMLKIARIAYRNGIIKKDIISYRKQGKTEYLKPYKNELKKAFEAESKSKVFAAVDKMEKAGISKEDIKKIKIDVFKDWKKKKSA